MINLYYLGYISNFGDKALIFEINHYILRVITIIMIEHQIYNIAVDTELDFTYFANNKHDNNKLIL